ncbi:hypothetical protein GGR57DRAFT_469050 [Xylariaceae sp. FL1272]|nr:hypothetical protein GGR57DRAFT_469050 [Xylariaceae sp. FL1272]
METLAAIGLAGNILSFVDFTAKLLVSARTIYKSASDASPENHVLQIIAQDVQFYVDNITTTGDIDQHLRSLAEESRNIADELLDLIRQVSARNKKSKYDCFLSALREVSKKSHIAALSNRLSKLQLQMSLHVQHTLLTQHTTSLYDIQADLKGSNTNLEHSLAKLRGENRKVAESTRTRDVKTRDKLDRCTAALGKIDRTGLRSFTRGRKELPPELFDLELPALRNRGDISKDKILYFNRFQNESANLDLQYRVIKSLRFNDMPLREQQIDKAQAQTFQWVLDESREDIGFVNWLRHSNSTFWIEGKAGSGKSTLMKYICKQPKTDRYLKEWAGASTLVTSKFFFWNSGTKLQKSQEGLLTSLLCRIFQQHPCLITHLSPQQVNLVNDAMESKTWDIDDLSNILHDLLRETPEIRYCFFIDGLDEFEGDLHDLIHILDTLSNIGNVKLCVSSRPEVQVTDAYSHLELLRVQDLTKKDIEIYASERLTKHKSFQNFNQKGFCGENIISQILKRADGVFLWVVLIVKSLIEGLDYGDNFLQMQQRLERLPDGMSAMCLQIIESIPLIYRLKVGRIFQIALATSWSGNSPSNLPLTAFAVLDEMDGDLQWPLQQERTVLSLEAHLEKVESAFRNLRRCKGLFDIPHWTLDERKGVHNRINVQTKVNWLHRSVRDIFMNSPEVQQHFQLDFQDKVQGTLALCGSYIGAHKWSSLGPNLNELRRSRELAVIYRTVREKARQAARTRDIVEQFMAFLEPFFTTIRTRDDSETTLADWTIIFAFIDDFDDQDKHSSASCSIVLEYAIEWKFFEYLDHRLQRDRSDISERLKAGDLWYPAMRQPEALRMLFAYGFHPNQRLFMKKGRDTSKASVWQALLQKIPETAEGLKRRLLGEIHRQWLQSYIVSTQVAIDHGADPDALIKLEDGSSLTARGLIERYAPQIPELRGIIWPVTESSPSHSVDIEVQRQEHSSTPTRGLLGWAETWLPWTNPKSPPSMSK